MCIISVFNNTIASSFYSSMGHHVTGHYCQLTAEKLECCVSWHSCSSNDLATIFVNEEHCEPVKPLKLAYLTNVYYRHQW